MTKPISWLWLMLALVAVPARGATLVTFSPSPATVALGSSFQIDLLATISNLSPDGVIAWGLDLSYDNTVLTLDGISIDPLWGAFLSPDGDGLAGALSFPSPPQSNTTVTLATLNFTAIALGSSSLDVGANDAGSEGFFLTGPGAKDPFSYVAGQVNVVPEPVPIVMLLGVFVIGGARWCRRVADRRCRASR